MQRTAPKYPKPPKPKTPKSRVQAGPEAGSPWLVQFMGQNKENMPVMRLYTPPPKKKKKLRTIEHSKKTVVAVKPADTFCKVIS